ncbi:unnamed protein product, partial [Onchocerca ochengi]
LRFRKQYEKNSRTFNNCHGHRRTATDGVARTALVKMPIGKYLTRPMNMLYPLEVSNTMGEDKKQAERDSDKQQADRDSEKREGIYERIKGNNYGSRRTARTRSASRR